MNTKVQNNQFQRSDRISRLKEKVETLKLKAKVLDDKLAIQNLALNSSLNSTLITDENGSIIWVNKAFSDLTGYKSDEVIGKNPRMLKSGIHDRAFYKDLWNTISNGKVWKGEIANKKKDGTLYYEKIEISPVFDAAGLITNYIAIKQDITSRKEIDQALNESYIKYEELAYIFNQSPAIGFLWSANDAKTVEFVTDNIKQWNYTPEDFYSQKLTFSDIIFEEDRAVILKDLSQKIESGTERIKQQYRIITKEGNVRWVDSHLYARLGENDIVTHLQGVVLDVTERINAEEESK
jgi:PAS domain S-box-containing protein